MKRRDLLKAAGATSIATLTGYTATATAKTQTTNTQKKPTARVVIVGGGTGGLSVAKIIKRANPEIEVTVVERNYFYTTCFGSNWILDDLVTMEDITFNYKKLFDKHQINVIHDEVIGVNIDKQQVNLSTRSKPLEYDRLIVSPGISFRWDAIEGHDERTSFLVPHAWKAGHETMILKEQLDAMPEDGTMVMASPPNPSRCPPGPYERASLIAAYMKREKPKAKLIILDAKDRFSKQDLFKDGWRKKYGFETDNATIEWVSKSWGGEVARIDPMKKELVTKEGETIKADVINYIPPQKASMTAVRMGLVNDSGWCPIDPTTFESSLIPNIHVLGDACLSGPMAKSAFVANSQAMACGSAVVSLLAGDTPRSEAFITNQCFSLISEHHAISVVEAYKAQSEGVKLLSSGLFPKNGKYAAEANAARGWYLGMAGAMFD